jgi:hypothetical protein
MAGKIRLGILGGGGNSLVGILHRIAASMHEKYDIVAGVFSRDMNSNVEFANNITIHIPAKHACDNIILLMH